MTLGEAEKKFLAELEHLYDREEAQAIAGLSLSHICRVSKGQLFLKRGEVLPAVEEVSLLMVLEELKAGKPLQYILGETEFYGLRFFVNPSVLIPRPETEELVHWILEVLSKEGRTSLSILDIGTGSGCIPITLKTKLPEATVLGIDISYEALQTAMKNAVLNEAEVGFRRVDILDPFSSSAIEDKFSLIVSNPPYVTHSEKEQMHSNVLEHEPHNALFVDDADPLVFYRQIAEFAMTHLLPEGLLFFEINQYLGKETVQLLEDKGLREIELRKDLFGRDRMIKATV